MTTRFPRSSSALPQIAVTSPTTYSLRASVAFPRKLTAEFNLGRGGRLWVLTNPRIRGPPNTNSRTSTYRTRSILYAERSSSENAIHYLPKYVRLYETYLAILSDSGSRRGTLDRRKTSGETSGRESARGRAAAHECVLIGTPLWRPCCY